MNRPEPIELENNLGPDAVTGEINRVPWMAYDVDEMDLYIAELEQKLAEKDKEIAELKKKLEDVQASHYAEMVDAGMRERRLKRALWLARALRARDIQRWWIAVTCSKTTERACSVWNNVERKCRAKAEEYK